jgi:hypothetical protein
LTGNGFNPPLPGPYETDNPDATRKLIELDIEYYGKKYNKEHPSWAWGISTERNGESNHTIMYANNGKFSISSMQMYNEKIDMAYKAARSARFEHGENGTS